MDEKITHLQFIQETIKRMAHNSFLIKGWSVTLVSALFALASKDANVKLVLLSYFPAIMFWILDSYFLHQEKLFRALYDDVRKNDTTVEKFEMNTSPYFNKVTSWSSIFFSKTIFIFHGSIIAVILFVMFFLLK